MTITDRIERESKTFVARAADRKAICALFTWRSFTAILPRLPMNWGNTIARKEVAPTVFDRVTE